MTGDPGRFAEVLVLATPCPLLIAAPVAFMGGMSRAARNGIIVKGGAALQQLARARSVAFDKTGTLTYGRPELVAVNPEPPFTADRLLQLAASAEQYSSHVLAAAVQDCRPGPRPGPERRRNRQQEVATNGVQATVDGHLVLVGKQRFVEAAAGGPAGAAAVVEPGQLVVYVAVDGRFAGTLTLSDTPRENAAATLDRLAALGIGPAVMLTGDGLATAESTAAALGIGEVHARAAARRQGAARGRPAPAAGDHGRRRRE